MREEERKDSGTCDRPQQHQRMKYKEGTAKTDRARTKRNLGKKRAGVLEKREKVAGRRKSEKDDQILSERRERSKK